MVDEQDLLKIQAYIDSRLEKLNETIEMNERLHAHILNSMSEFSNKIRKSLDKVDKLSVCHDYLIDLQENVEWAIEQKVQKAERFMNKQIIKKMKKVIKIGFMYDSW